MPPRPSAGNAGYRGNQNNAGAAMEVLGLRAPQVRNVEIANSRFPANNTARKLGPAEIYVWGKSPSSEICCSTGSIHDNGYVLLRLVADDGELWMSDMTTVHILPPGMSVTGAWEFNTPLDKEGWTEKNLGTRIRHWANDRWPTTSHPVKYGGGGFYIVAVENSSNACLLSPDHLDVDLRRNKTIRIRFQNHTPARRMRFRFTTATAPAWQDANSKSFDVVPNDATPRVYTVDMADVPGWTGRLRQLRLDLGVGTPITGTCRVDYIWICN